MWKQKHSINYYANCTLHLRKSEFDKEENKKKEGKKPQQSAKKKEIQITESTVSITINTSRGFSGGSI